MAAPSPMATAMQKARERFFPKLGDAHTKFRANPVILTLDTGMMFFGVGSVAANSFRPVYHYLYHKVTGELHEEVKHEKTMLGLPKRVTTLEEKANMMCGLPTRVTALEEKVRALESRQTLPSQAAQVPTYNTPTQAARNVIRRATSSNLGGK